jgi:hypothetical protein
MLTLWAFSGFPDKAFPEAGKHNISQKNKQYF